MTNGFRADETMRIMIPSEEVDAKRTPTDLKTVKKARANIIKNKLGESEYSLYAQFMDSIYDAVLVTDWQGKILDSNSRASEFFQSSGEKIFASSIFEVFYGFNALMLDRIRRNVSQKKKFALIEAYCCRLDGSVFPSEIAVNKMNLGGEDFLSFFVRDTTRRKEDEKKLKAALERLAQSERMEAAGRMAGLIAHDFNNLLTPLLGYPDLIKEELPEGSPARKDLEVIADTAQRMADINQQLLMLSRRGRCEHHPVDINSVVRNLIDLVRRDSKDKIGVTLDLAEDLFSVTGAEEQLFRVVQNLYQNAIDAMEDTGSLTIKTENIYLDQKPDGDEMLSAGEYVKLSVSDTGHGIPNEIRDRLFEPFFSTRQSGARRRGAGLGMSVVYGVVQDHKGRIEVESEVGQGTTFTILLPAERRSDDVKVSPEIMARGKETILVVDDDEMQVTALTKILEKLGYSVLSADSGEKTISIVEKSKASETLPCLAVIDMVMGHGMDGAETYQRLKEIHPDLKAIFISGYRESPRVTFAQSIGGGAFLAKPVSAEKLGAAIRAELDKKVQP